MTKVIAIDAGHGHNTQGRRCDVRYDASQTPEWDLSNRVANYQEQYFQAYDVVVIRLDDRSGVEDVSLRARCNKANANNCSIVISNHHNAAGGNGLESFYDKSISTSSSEYQIYKTIHQATIASSGQRDRGLKSSSQSAPGDLAILRDTKMPAILIEAGFMDNAIDTPKIITDAFARSYAMGVVQGVVQALNIGPKNSSSGNNNSNVGNGSSGYQGNSIVDYLNSIGQNSSFANRSNLAAQLGINNYTGTASQNIQLLNILRNNGTPNTENFYPAVNSGSIVDALKSINVDSSFTNRNKIANGNGITNYGGTNSQNILLLSLLRQGKLKRV